MGMFGFIHEINIIGELQFLAYSLLRTHGRNPHRGTETGNASGACPRMGRNEDGDRGGAA